MPQFTEDALQRVLINPFYVLTVAPHLTWEHEPPVGEEAWVEANASLIRDGGAVAWLKKVLDVLEGQASPADDCVSPYQAVNIDPLFAVEHSPIIERAMWIEANAVQIRTMGAQKWLQQLLDVLNGDIVTAREVGLAAPDDPFVRATRGGLRSRSKNKKRKKRRPHR